MKRIIILVLCVLLTATLFGCRNTDDVEIYLADIAVYGGYLGELLTEFDVDAIFKSIDEEDHIAEGKETKTLSLLESEAVNKRIQARLAEETNEEYTAELKTTTRAYLESGEVAVLYIYDVTYTVDEEDADTAAFDNISRVIVVMVK